MFFGNCWPYRVQISKKIGCSGIDTFLPVFCCSICRVLRRILSAVMFVKSENLKPVKAPIRNKSRTRVSLSFGSSVLYSRSSSPMDRYMFSVSSVMALNRWLLYCWLLFRPRSVASLSHALRVCILWPIVLTDRPRPCRKAVKSA